MLIRRCAWHPVYNGYPMLYGVTAWRQPGLQYTDGMCRRCAVTAMREWRGGAAAARPRLRGAGLAVAAASILAVLALTVAVMRDGGVGDAPVSALPRAASDAPGPPPR